MDTWKETHIVEGKLEDLARYLLRKTRPYWHVDLGEGKSLQVQCARPRLNALPDPDDAILEMEAFLLKPDPDNPNAAVAWPVGSAVEFRLLRITDNRTEVTVQCHYPQLTDRVQALIAAVLETWPHPVQSAAQRVDAPRPETSEPAVHKGEEADCLAAIREGPDRDIIRLWREGYTASEIAEQSGFASKTVSNRICELRKTFGDGVVPRRRPHRWKN